MAVAVNAGFDMGAGDVSSTADVTINIQQPTDTSSSVALEMHHQTTAHDETSTTDGSSIICKDESMRGNGTMREMGQTEYRIWFGVFVSLIIFGSLLLIINAGIAMYCLNDQAYTTAICSVESESFGAADELRKFAETTEPAVSIFIVVLAMILTYKSRFNKNDCRARSLMSEELFSTLRNLFKKYWFSTYLTMVIFSFAYHIVIFILDVKKQLEGSFRYLTLPLGLTSWFVWLVALNESGAMTTVLKKTYSGDQVSRLHNLYGVLLIFAGITNFTEFLIYTIYLTGALTTIVASLKLLTYMEFVGMTLTVALRYSLASFFFQMFYVGEKKYKLLNDPWTEEKP
ncbi:uncharacterized protein [Ptychodera flava]|uniref:uncharacterized protein n=1 Tax=Ptychodera flava TaxID=63121 RepID=UPI00396A4BC9